MKRMTAAEADKTSTRASVLASCAPVHHPLPMSDEQACPGRCNSRYREAREAFKAALLAYDLEGRLDANQSRPIPPNIQPDLGNPWCGTCKSRIREALAELDILASLLAATADGHRHGPGTERVSGSAVYLSPSTAGDDLDELISMLSGWEDAYRDHAELGPQQARRGQLAAPETEIIAWLMRDRRLDAILTAPFAVDFGHGNPAVAPGVQEQVQGRGADRASAGPLLPVQVPHAHLDRRGHVRDLP